MVAVKVLALREMRSWKSLELFEREAKTLRALSHPAIPDYIDYFQIETSGDVKYCLVQRIAPGDTLQSLVDDGWRPTEAEVESVAVQLLEVLGYLGSLRPPVAHRDVKPGNVLLERLSGRVSLVDFGATADAGVTAAMAEDAAAVRAAGSGDGFGSSGFVAGSTMVGTFGYCAPEQMLGLVTPASDLYSAGATLLFLLSGRAPATMPQSRLKINFRGIVTIENARLEALVGRLLEPAAEDRFQTAAEAFRALTAPVAPRGGGGAMGGRNFRGGGDEKGEGGGEGVSSSISERRPWDDVDLDLAGLAGDGGGVTVPGIFPYPGAGGGDGIQQQRSDSGGSRAVEEDRTRPWRRIRQPAGTRVVVEREGKTKLLIVIPPQGVTMASAGTGAFALAWNGFIAFWTASALAAGGGLVMAAFTIPFWLAGSSVAKTAFEQVFEASRLEVDAFQFSQTTTATGLVSKTTAGEVDDLQGVRLVVESTSNDEPNVCLELEYGATPVRFGRGLTPIELEFVAAEVNAFIHELST
uniref:non-specific serine/threonine protein kinase n=1 Tax=Mantoniella antarctica TaxID=81844 RepID=A0A7S0X762_9CHLO